MRVLWITVVAILLDQATKWAVVEYMYLGQSIPLIGDWFRLTFTTNPGMAFGINFGPPGLVTMLSLVATALIVFYMYTVRRGYTPYLASLALILGGALGNIIDRVFYGVIYEGGRLFTGEVVDFIHFNIWRGYVPSEVPLLGGSYVALFPIWNMADMAIVAGVVGILVFQNRFHESAARKEAEAAAPVMEDGQPAPATYHPVSAEHETPRPSSVTYTQTAEDEPIVENRERRGDA